MDYRSLWYKRVRQWAAALGLGVQLNIQCVRIETAFPVTQLHRALWCRTRPEMRPAYRRFTAEKGGLMMWWVKPDA